MKTSLWMPMWWGDHLADTQHLSTTEQGAYLLLIAAYWTTGRPLPDDDEKLRNITRLAPKVWRKARHTISAFFQIGDGVWRHKRVDSELGAALERARKRSSKASKGAFIRWHKNGQEVLAKPKVQPKDQMLGAILAPMPGECLTHTHIEAIASIEGEDPPSPPIQKNLSPAGESQKKVCKGADPQPLLREPEKARRGSRIPEDFGLSPERLAWAHEHTGLSPAEIVLQTETFVDYFRGKAGAAGVKLDWDATWRNWLRRSPDFHRGHHDRSPAKPDLRLPFGRGGD